MSTPQATRGQRGGSSNRGSKGAPTQTARGRGSSRGTSNSRGRERGRGTFNKGANDTTSAGGPNSAGGLLQRVRDGKQNGTDNGTSTRGAGRGASRATPFTPGGRGQNRGRGRGFANNTRTSNTPRSGASTPSSRASPALFGNNADQMHAKYAEFQTLKPAREKERAQAIRDGFLADPEKKTSLDNAITPVGTCTDMCPHFERVERIVQNMVDRAEKDHDEEDGKDYPDEDRMIKRFRRSAAGYDEQLPSDIRTPETLKRTLDYLFDKVIGGAERLATVQKFVWDRTRGIRNDFSIQQVTNVEDVKLAVECFERIARFHILTLHQLSNPDNLQDGEHFDSFQEREQLNNTLLSLVYYYDDHRDRVEFPNEAEFRAYMVIFEIATRKADIEDRLQSWPKGILRDARVKTALKLYAAAGSTTQPQGPLNPLDTAAIAQGNGGSFWNVLASRSVPYIMACLAELYFFEVRFSSLDALWRASKAQSQNLQARSRDWTLSDVTDFLGLDTEDQARDFCEAFDLSFAPDGSGGGHLDLRANTATYLEKSSTPTQQIFSHKYVEKKRYRRTLTSVINGSTVSDAVRSGSTESMESDEENEPHDYEAEEDDESMFVPEDEAATPYADPPRFGKSSLDDPSASSFTPDFETGNIASSPIGRPTTESSFGKSSGFGGFGSAASSSAIPSNQPRTDSTFGTPPTTSGFGSSTAPSSFGKPANAGGFDSQTTSAPFGSTSTFGNSTTQQSQPAAPTFPGFGVPTAPSSSSGVNPGGFGASTTPSTSTFGRSDPLAKPSLSAAPLFGPAPGSTTFAPPNSSPASTFKPLFGRPLNAVNPPAPAHSQDKSSTPHLFFSNDQPSSTTTPITQPSEIKSQATPHAPTERFTFQPQPTQPPSNESSSSFFTKVTHETPANRIGKTPFTPFVAPESVSSSATGIGKTPFKPFFESKENPQPSVGTSPSTTTEPKFKFAQPQFEKSPSAPIHTSPEPQRSTTPPQSPRQPPAKPVLTRADRQQYAANVARLGFTQRKGLLNSFLEFALRDLLTATFKQHQRELREAAITSIRSRILARKFGHIWRQRAWNNSLNRRAKNRRQMFAETIRAEQARKQRSEEELEEILKAAQESKRIQKEVEENVKKQKRPSVALNGAGVVKVAGQKRKSFSGQEPSASTMSSSNGPASTPGHKRSKTVSTSGPSTSTSARSPTTPSFRTSTSRPQHVSIFSRSSNLGRSTSNSDLRKSVPAQKLDTTRTDYFRLKAIGVDPDTPIIPDTQKSLALRQQREAEERQASINRANRRIRASPSSHTSPTSMPPPPLPQPRTSEAPPTPSTSPSPIPIEDDFLKQIREAREAMAEQTEWFKQQSGTLEQEIEQEEEFRRSQSSREATPPSSSGLAKANGYEYLPADTKPGLSLSRTERRIRQTGAHGLATKSLHSGSDYVPVAMSKRSALNYTSGARLSPGRKRSHDDVEPSTEIETAHQAALPALKRPRAAAQQPQEAMALKPRPRPAARNGSQNPYALLQSVDPEEGAEDQDDEHDTEEIDDEDGEEAGQPGPYPFYFQANGSYADDEEEDIDDENENEHRSGAGLGPADGEYQEDEEDFEEEEEDDEEGYEYPGQYLQGGQEGLDDADAPTPASHQQVSRAASSALGGSVDDAFVIDDSD